MLEATELPKQGLDYFLLGDIVINIHLSDRMGSDDKGKDEILLELLIHGLLHLVGFDHEKSEEEYTKMKRAEQDMIDAIKKLDNKP